VDAVSGAAAAAPPSGLRQLREALELSVRDVANRSGVVARTLERVEAETIRPHPRVVAKLAPVLGLTPHELCERLSAVRRTTADVRRERGLAPRHSHF
jgi:transcriptional regulator with XRE-family HTH domain